MRSKLHSVVLAALVPSAALAHPQCDVIDLGTVGGFVTTATSVNADGTVVVGTALPQPSAPSSQLRFWRWTRASGAAVTGVTGYEPTLAREGETVLLRDPDVFANDRLKRWTHAGGVQSLVGLGINVTSPGNETLVETHLSKDGSVIVGMAWNGTGQLHAFRWTEAGGIVDLGTLGGVYSIANAVSADGATVVGNATNVLGESTAFRWTAATGMQEIPVPGGQFTSATHVSADGMVVVGRGTLWGSSEEFVFRWSLGGAAEIIAGPLPGTAYFVVALSEDGSVVVGNEGQAPGPVTSNLGDGVTTGFHWTASTGYRALAQQGDPMVVRAMSVDGRVAGGMTRAPADGPEAFRAVFDGAAAPAIERLPGLGGSAAGVEAVSADGAVLVGWATDAAGRRHAARWTRSTLGDVYCASSPSSLGCGARIALRGSADAADRDLVLEAWDVPAAAFGLFVVSTSAGSATPIGSAGTLCLGGAIGRLNRPGEVQSAGASGTFHLELDPAALPTPNAYVAALPGQTWHFQAWYADPSGPTGSNFTEAVRVTLQ